MDGAAGWGGYEAGGKNLSFSWDPCSGQASAWGWMSAHRGHQEHQLSKKALPAFIFPLPAPAGRRDSGDLGWQRE